MIDTGVLTLGSGKYLLIRSGAPCQVESEVMLKMVSVMALLLDLDGVGSLFLR